MSNNILSFFTLSGTGSAVVKVSKNVSLGVRSSITTQQGDLTVEANWNSTTSGNFSGVSLPNLSLLGITGTGQLTVRGKGGDAGANNNGIVVSGGTLRGGTTGTTLVEGLGGLSSGNTNQGVYSGNIGGGVTTLGSDLVVNGRGGGVSSSVNNYGVIAGPSGGYSVGGTGKLTMTGTGGSSSGASNTGVVAIGAIGSQATGGDVVINGIKGANSASAWDVHVHNTGGISGRESILINSLVGGFYPNNVVTSFFNASTTKTSTFTTGSKFNYYVGGPTRLGATGGQYFPMQVIGLIDLNNVELVTSGGYVPTAGTEFPVVINDGTDAVIGKFKYNGVVLNEGAQVPSFRGSSVPFYITYSGGDGNDVVILSSKIIFSTPSVIPQACDGVGGSIDITATGGTSGISYSISPNIGTQNSPGSFYGLTANTYTITASDGNCTRITTTIKIEVVEGCGNIEYTVTGAARTESNTLVDNVTVSAKVNGTLVATNNLVNGSFNMTMSPANIVQIRVAKNNDDDAASGVTTFDIMKVGQHFLGVEPLATPYKLIAADVDKSGEIDLVDMLYMRRFILRTIPSFPAGNFRFIDKAYNFINPENPFNEDFPEVVNIATLNTNRTANLVAVKLGDVNDSYNALAPRVAHTLTFQTEDKEIIAGNEYTINISADKLDVASFQGTFSFTGATVKTVKAGNLNNVSNGSFGVFTNAVTTSWNGKKQDDVDVLTITFVANKSGKLSDMLTINSALTQAVASDEVGNEMNMKLKFNTGKVAGGEFALYQNQPNPSTDGTIIGFNLPNDTKANLTIMSVDGRVVKVVNGQFKAGYNLITVNKSDLKTSGVFYYRLETGDHSATKKMIVID